MSADEAAKLRPLVEQHGRASARGLLTGLAFAAVAVVMILVALVLNTRDVRACRAFLDRYESSSPNPA